jgi:hypothetical protein
VRSLLKGAADLPLLALYAVMSAGARAADYDGSRSTFMTRRAWNLLASAGGAVITYRCARATDALVLRVVHPPRGEVLLTYTSDAQKRSNVFTRHVAARDRAS